MQKIALSNDLSVSPVIHGHWRLRDWKLTPTQLLNLTEKLIDIGITTFDHADIYGDYSCENLFGEALALKKELRKDIEIITKCGIKLVSDKYPERKLKHYDYSYDHIIASVDTSLNNFGTNYIDLLLLHRPSPFFDPEEVAKAFDYLKQSGKVLNFGVSNFNPLQYEMLENNLDVPLVTNQVEISPYCLEHFKNGNIDFFLRNKIKPMAWSPLGGGEILKPLSDKGHRLFVVLNKIKEELNAESIEKVIYSWLIKHPAKIIPIVGSGRFERLQTATEALNIEMSLAQWFEIYNASEGIDLP